MSTTVKIKVKDQDPVNALRTFLGQVLAVESMGALLVPLRLPGKPSVMPSLVTDAQHLAAADPLAPAFPVNAAKLVSRLTRKPMGRPMAAVLRACEIRAFTELVKLHQGSCEGLTIIGIDCLGAFTNTDYLRLAAEDPEGLTRRFVTQALVGEPPDTGQVPLAKACRACEQPVPEGADILITLYGQAPSESLSAVAQSEKGDALLETLDLPAGDLPTGRKAVVDRLVAQRTTFRDALLAETHTATESLAKLADYLAGCVNCYNCRVACPVCYCRECVFVTDVFDHDPAQYLGWATRKGAIKMPTDTLFYHLTRLAHMSTACVGCGQCSNACPNDIPVMALFRMVAARTQAGFNYLAGRSVNEKPPLAEFKEDEYQEVVGLIEG